MPLTTTRLSINSIAENSSMPTMGNTNERAMRRLIFWFSRNFNI